MEDNTSNSPLLRELSRLGCQLIGLGFLLHSLSDLPYLLYLIIQLDLTSNVTSQFLGILLYALDILLPLTLILGADLISRRLVADLDVDVEYDTEMNHSILVGILCLGGIWFLVGAFPRVIDHLLEWSSGVSVTRELSRSGFRVVLGVLLFFESDSVAKMLQKSNRWKSFHWVSYFYEPFWIAIGVVTFIFWVILMVNK